MSTTLSPAALARIKELVAEMPPVSLEIRTQIVRILTGARYDNPTPVKT